MPRNSRLEEIERRLRRVSGFSSSRVVGIGQRADVPDDEGAVGILERRVDGVEALRLEGEHLALPLPAHEVLRGLEQHHVGLELAVLELLLDLLIEHVAEAAVDRHREARKLALELARQRLVVRHRPAGIDHERLFGLGLGVELVERFGVARCTEQHDRGGHQRQRAQGRWSRRGEHSFLPRRFSRDCAATKRLSQSTPADGARARRARGRRIGEMNAYSASCIGAGT